MVLESGSALSGLSVTRGVWSAPAGIGACVEVDVSAVAGGTEVGTLVDTLVAGSGAESCSIYSVGVTVGVRAGVVPVPASAWSGAVPAASDVAGVGLSIGVALVVPDGGAGSPVLIPMAPDSRDEKLTIPTRRHRAIRIAANRACIHAP
jgi:hypothetical protein